MTSPRGAPGAPAVPRMGVRARIAEWPPKREQEAGGTGARARGGTGGGVANGHPGGLGALQRLARRRCKDAELQEGCAAAAAPLRQRSSSELTLSEADGAEAEAAAPRSGAPLFREYGSTSSIDAQGVSEQSFAEMLDALRGARDAPAKTEAAAEANKERPRKKGSKWDAGGGNNGGGGGESLFKKLRSGRGDAEAPKEAEEAKGWRCPRGFAHYDVQSLLFDPRAAAAARGAGAQRRNTTTGASAASARVAAAATASAELEADAGDATSNELLLSCPHFRNEIGGAGGGGGGERSLSFAGTAEHPARCANAGVSVLEVPKELQGRLQRYSVEHVDLGARYYREHFHGKEHSNYFGIDDKLGPVAVSIKREKLEDHKEHGPQYQYRIILRTSELVTLRGSILEDATPTATKAGTPRGLPLRDALEHVVPELNLHCLRLALSAPRVAEQLLKLDEQGLCRKHKVGILYCKAGQSSEEEMYNNEAAGPALAEFLALLGDTVPLKAFAKYAAQLDTKTDSTGTHSLYTTFQDYEIMFHVSTMLPYTPNNRQQLLRKRHIGNDIVTIIFQEPGALPFTPQSVRSHFQHVFIIVRAHNPCTDAVRYSVAVTRSKDVPPFGPPVPAGAAFRKSDAFRAFLLAKAINAENAAHKAAKFHAMATRTRREYLQDLAENCVTNTGLDSGGKFNLMALAKKKEKTKARAGAEQLSAGAIAWHVGARDFARGADVPCVLGISNEFVVLLDVAAKEVVFNCLCGDVIGWTADGAALKVFYGRGDHVLIQAAEGGAEDVKEIVQRLKVTTSGCDTVDMTLRRNGLGQLGFHVKADGTVAEVEDYGFAWQAGLRQGSRLVEICKVAVVTLSHEQMIDLLRTSVTVKVVIVPPHEDGAPRRGWAEALEPSGAEPKADPDGSPAASRPPFRSNPGWQWNIPTAPAKWPEATARGQSLGRAPKAVPYGKRPVSFPETPHPAAPAAPAAPERVQPHRQPSGSFSGTGASARYRASPERYERSSGDSVSGGSSHESTMERHKPEPLWHVPAHSRLPGSAGKRAGCADASGKDSPSRNCKGDAASSGSNTLSSTASSSADGTKGDSDSGIDAAPRGDKKGDPAPGGATAGATAAGHGAKGYRGKTYAATEPCKPSSLTPRTGFPASKAPAGDASRPAPGPFPLSASVPKSFFSKQTGRNKQIPGWKRDSDGAARSGDSKKPVAPGATNVFGQPRLRASLRDLRSPRRSHKSSIEDDLKRLILMDGGTNEAERDASPLQRTLSDESLCSARRDGAATEPDGIFGSPFPAGTVPGRRQHPDKKGTISASELSLSEPRDKPARRLDPGMMPLPDTAAGLEWASLVNAAKAYEVQRAVSLFSLAEPAPSPECARSAPALSEEPPLDLPGKVFQLEAMLKQLHSDLQKEKQAKVVLQAEVASLRQNNQRLQEESQSASEQLRRFARIFSGASDGNTEP